MNWQYKKVLVTGALVPREEDYLMEMTKLRKNRAKQIKNKINNINFLLSVPLLPLAFQDIHPYIDPGTGKEFYSVSQTIILAINKRVSAANS